MHDIRASVSDLGDLLVEYDQWCRTDGDARFSDESRQSPWKRPWMAPFVVRHSASSEEELRSLRTRFGDKLGDYPLLVRELGPFAFRSGSYGLLRVLSPSEVEKLHAVVQDEMDVNDGLREEILEEDGLDFADLVPVMAGEGLDGMWALLDTSSEDGRIIYWDTDEPGNLVCIFPNVASFVASLLATARDPAMEPPRLT